MSLEQPDDEIALPTMRQPLKSYGVGLLNPNSEFDPEICF
jgi:hypothetical protein